MRFIFLIFTSLILFSATCSAKIIELHRGISTDVWITWPNEPALKNNPKLLNIFPQWRTQIGAKQIANLRMAGFDFVRLTIDPFAYIWQASPEKSAKLNANVVQTIKLFRDQNLNVLVDFHAVPKGEYRQFGIETYLASLPAFADFVTQATSLAEALSNQDPAHVAFEPINEPVLDCEVTKTNHWPAMAIHLHDAVRAAAPKLTLIVQGACWGGADGLVRLNPATFHDENLIWDFHSYDPFIFTHQSAAWTEGVEKYVSGLHFPAEQKQKKDQIMQTIARIKTAKLPAARKRQLIRQATYDLSEYFRSSAALAQHQRPFKKVLAWAKKYHVPSNQILLGEFGANRTEETAIPLAADRLRFVERTRMEAEKNGFAWAFWDWSGSMSPTNNDTDRLVLPSYITALGLSPQNQ